MKIIFFTEGGKNIGFGHIFRCLSLAQAFLDLKCESKFIISGDDTVLNIINDFEFELHDWFSDQNNLTQKTETNDIVVIDSYNATNSLINQYAQNNKNIIFFDDYNRIEYPTGVLINGALNAEKIYPKRNPKLKYLLGGKFQTIRQEFWKVKVSKKNSSIKKIFITFGGDDSRNLTPHVMELFNKYYPDQIKNIIIGNSFANKEEIKNKLDSKTNLIFNPRADQILQLMLEADLAICGAGQTLYELARTKTPALFIGIAENQKNNIKSWEDYPYFSFCGWWNDKDIIGRLYQSFIKFDDNFEQISEEIYSSDFIIDGNGSKNIVEEVLSYVRS